MLHILWKFGFETLVLSGRLWPFYWKKRHFGNFDRQYLKNGSITFEILV